MTSLSSQSRKGARREDNVARATEEGWGGTRGGRNDRQVMPGGAADVHVRRDRFQDREIGCARFTAA